MPLSPDDINLDDSTLDYLLELDLTTFDSTSPQSFLTRRSPAVAEASIAPAYQPGYNSYGESLSPFGEHFTPASPSINLRPNQNITQCFTVNIVNHHDPQGLAIAFHGSAGDFSRTVPPVASPLKLSQQNQNTVHYVTVNSNDSPSPATAFDGPADDTFYTASPWPLRLDSPGHGREQADPGTIFRCDYPGCTYGGTFTIKGSLTRHHEEQHTSRRSFPCPTCGKIYSRNHHMADHHLRAHGKQA
ncbi:hypothetical protein N7453_000626 [Penicillium expansum]|nr:hypothetical protein N7453_000626 [Penicillium expansum]